VNGWLVPSDGPLDLSGLGLWTHVGCFWRDHRCYRIECTTESTLVSCERRKGLGDYWTVNFDSSFFSGFLSGGYENMASKWISAAVKVAEKRTELCSGNEDVLFKSRPALRDFMTCLEGQKDVPREPSVLMIACSEMGLRVGLKDDTAGGWLWREGITLAEALDAVEKALQSGSPVFSVQGGRRGRRR
jgi:hypothetical protein